MEVSCIFALHSLPLPHKLPRTFFVVIYVQIEETDINLDFMRHLIPGLYWPGVVLAAKAVGFEGLPDSFSAEILDDEGVLQVLHRLLFDTHIIEGTLICPESGQRFPISDGIPNMM